FVSTPVRHYKQVSNVMRQREARQKEKSQNSVAEYGHQHGDHTHELKPVARGHSFTTSTHGLFGQEIQSTAVAIHGNSPVRMGFKLRSLPAYCFWAAKTTGQRASFGSGLFSCTKV